MSALPSSMKGPLLNLSHILDYLSQIERCLENSRSPALEFQHCYVYGGRGSKTFFKSAGSTMAKPMMRTLIYGGLPMEGNFVKNDLNDMNSKSSPINKSKFDQLIRDVRSSLEFQRMHHFIEKELLPAVLSMTVDDRETLIPDALRRIEEIVQNLNPRGNNADDVSEHDSPTKFVLSKQPKVWFNLLSRIASGRKYRGKLNKLIDDLFPHLVDKYNDASRKCSEREIFEQIIIMELHQMTVMNGPAGESTRHGNVLIIISPKIPGRMEKMQRPLLQNKKYTLKRRENDAKNHARCPPLETQKQKYKPPKPHRNGSGIIWTNFSESNGTSRHGICSEFDNVVIVENIQDRRKSCSLDNSNETTLESIWEAKHTISPSTLYDVLTKKLGAIEALMEDSSTELAYMGDVDNMTSLRLFPSHEAATIIFGVYGKDLLPPENAADSIRSVATSNIISSDLNEVINALERDGDVIMIEETGGRKIKE
ncbi:hypothetical protein ACHAXS_009872 [Conticribra weissflogii]